MWPFGFLVSNSAYSPFQLERDAPGVNWRDAFEDLLALESGGNMISADDRKMEKEVANRLYSEDIHDIVGHVNET